MKTIREQIEAVADANNLRVVSISEIYINEFGEKLCDIRFHIMDLFNASEERLNKIESAIALQLNADTGWPSGQDNMLRVRMKK